MKGIIKNAILSIIVGMALNGFSVMFGSPFLLGFINGNLITLLIALLAINTTTMSVTMTKMSELNEKFKAKFPCALKEMKISIYEQVFLICAAISLQMVSYSSIVKIHSLKSHYVISSLLVAVFVYAMLILFDTAKAIFVLLEYDQ